MVRHAHCICSRGSYSVGMLCLFYKPNVGTTFPKDEQRLMKNIVLLVAVCLLFVIATVGCSSKGTEAGKLQNPQTAGAMGGGGPSAPSK